MSENDNRPGNEREWKLIEKMLLSAQAENRKQRRWNIFFRFLFLGYLLLVLIWFMPSGSSVPSDVGQPHTAMVRVDGEIAGDKQASADNIIEGLRDAFKANNSKAVMLRINSPGGSPVQAGEIYREIMRLKKKYPQKKVYAVITDMGASGAYYIASAADDIYADQASIVGSIGVIMSSFGLKGAIDKLGVERRVYTAGKHKDMLDPFQPVKPDEREHVQKMLDDVHRQFIDAVKKGRGKRLINDPQKVGLFSGLFWTGDKAMKLGLVDGLKSPGEVARDVVGAKKIVDYTPQRSTFEQLLHRFGTSVGSGIAHALGVRAGSLQGLTE